MKKFYLFLIGFVLFTHNLFSQNKGIDSSYGQGGVVTYAITATVENGNTIPYKIFADSLNRIISFGQTSVNGFFTTRWSANGNIDSSFGTNGSFFIAQTSSNTNSFLLRQVQKDGKLILAGFVSTSFLKDIYICRYNTNGTLDNTFGINGVRTIAISTQDDTPNDLTLTDDGKIVIAGLTQPGSANQSVFLMRLLSNGFADTSFNHTGFKVDFFSGTEIPRKVLVQPDGKIVVGGDIFILGWDYDIYMARYLQNGNADSSFGAAGIGKASFAIAPIGNDNLKDMKLLPDGKIITLLSTNTGPCLFQITSAGNRNYGFSSTGAKAISAYADQLLVDTANNFYTHYAGKVRKYLSNGNVDSSFALYGLYDYKINAGADTSQYLVQLKNQSFRCVGQKTNNGKTHLVMNAFTSNGQILSSFGQSGNKILQYAYANIATPFTIAGHQALSDGNLYISILIKPDTINYFGLVKFFPDGSRDMNFAGNGMFLYPYNYTLFNQYNTPNTAFKVKPDGTILVSLITQRSFSFCDILLFKIDRYGFVISSFGQNGITKDSSVTYSTNSKIDFQSDGKIIFAGPQIYRYFPNGLRDTSFHPVQKPIAGMLVLDNDKIMIALDSMVQRLYSNGNIDPGFGTNGYFTSFVSYNPGLSGITRAYCQFRNMTMEPGSRRLTLSGTLTYLPFGLNHSFNFAKWFRVSENGILDPSPSPFFIINDMRGSLNQISFSDYSYFCSAYLASGTLWNQNGRTWVQKIHSNGIIDSSFGTNGNLPEYFGIIPQPSEFTNYSIDYSEICRINDDQTYWIRMALSKAYITRINSELDFPLDFTANKTNIGFKDTVNFTVQFLGPTPTYQWSFTPNSITYLGGTDSSSTNPKVKFNKEGYYEVKLKVSYSNTSKILVKSKFIHLFTTLDFIANQTNIPKGDSIIFTPVFSDSAYRYQWSIKTNYKTYLAGTDSNSKNPVVKFTELGNYDVSLKAFYRDTFIITNKYNYIKVLPGTGLLNFNNNLNLSIYPNPTESSITIQSDVLLNKAKCMVYDLQGKLISVNDLQAKDNIIFLPETSGIYLIMIQTQDGIFSLKKVVKE